MSPAARVLSQIEPLEARIAPAVIITNPLPDIIAGPGKTGATLDLSRLTAPASNAAYHTFVEIITNYDTDPNTPGLQAGKIGIELYDKEAPLTVQNFLRYLNNPNPLGDYDGTLFHRAVPGFVLQGGGYETSTPPTHIPVFPAVHNEPNISNRSNVEGSVAMAKAGNDPNSATSEWFVNLGDNNTGPAAGNLDLQNGGFTVFGRVSGTGLLVAKAISLLPKTNIGLGAAEAPFQNGHPIRMVDAKVIPAPGTSTLHYSVESIVDVVTSMPSNVLTASVAGSKLLLQYAPGKTGTVDVKVKITDGTVTKTDTFRVDVRPNLIVKIDSDALPGVIVPGDLATVKFRVSNTGASTALGIVDLKVSLAKLTVTKNANGQITALDLPANPTLTPVATLSNVSLNLGGGLSQVFAPQVKIPTTLAPTAEEFFQLIVQVVPKTGSALGERYSDDNVALNGFRHQLVNEFGTFTTTLGSRTNAVLKQTVNDVANHPTLLTWSMTGPGFGLLPPNGKTLEVLSSTAASTLTATVPVGSAHVPLQSVNIANFLGNAALGSIDVTGPVIASGGVRTLTLGDLTGQSLLLIGAALPDNAARAAITLRHVKNFSLESDMPLASLKVADWDDTAGSFKDTITAPSLGSLRATGDFEADLTLTDDLPVASISISGALRNATLKTAGNIGAITLGKIESSGIFAGTEMRPVILSDFTNARTISSFTLTGIAGDSGALFFDSDVAAQTISAIKVQRVTEGGSGEFGFVADVIGSYSRTGGPTRTNVTTAQTFDDLGAYVVKVL